MARLLPLLLLLLSACATRPPLDAEGVLQSVTPAQAVTEAQRVEGTAVLWGGVIVASHNEPETTRLEVLAYPLNDRQRPRTEAEPLGRFLAEKGGYLETEDYAAGREVSLVGTVEGTRAGRIGEAEYTYPLVRIRQLHLWPRPRAAEEPRFHFGIGVIFGN